MLVDPEIVAPAQADQAVVEIRKEVGSATAIPVTKILPVWGQVNDPVVPEAKDDQVSIVGDVQVDGVVELTLEVALTTEFPQEASVRIEDLDAVVVAVGDEDFSVRGQSEASGLVELGVSVTRRAKGQKSGTIAVKDLDTVVAGVADVDAAVGAQDEILGVVHLARGVSAGGDDPDERGVGVDFKDPVAGYVGDEESALGSGCYGMHLETVRAIKAIGALVAAVLVEDLDSLVVAVRYVKAVR